MAFGFAFDAVAPLVILVFVGVLLKKLNILNAQFSKAGNKLVFKVLLPVLLFRNIYSIGSFREVNFYFVLYSAVSIVVLFVLGIAAVMLLCKDNNKRGVLLQCIFRSNYAMIGIQLATELFGAEGASVASLIAAIAVPLFNILGVTALAIFSPPQVDENGNKKSQIGVVAKGIVTNPLIIGVACGLVALLVRQILLNNGITLKLMDIKWLNSTTTYIANCATPIALIVLGSEFSFSAVKSQWKEILIGVCARCVVVPALGIAMAILIFPEMSGQYFATLIALYATPVAVSSAIMAKEMGSDGELAGQLVIWTTITSILTIFVCIVVMYSMGVFV